jgi:hypothetical protein
MPAALMRRIIMVRSHSGDAITERVVEAYLQIENPRLREVMTALILKYDFQLRPGVSTMPKAPIP